MGGDLSFACFLPIRIKRTCLAPLFQWIFIGITRFRSDNIAICWRPGRKSGIRRLKGFFYAPYPASVTSRQFIMCASFWMERRNNVNGAFWFRKLSLTPKVRASLCSIPASGRITLKSEYANQEWTMNITYANEYQAFQEAAEQAKGKA